MIATTLALALALGGGAQGQVVIDPARPVCMVGQTCSAPDAHELLVFRRGPSRVASTTTDAAGRFRISLPAGLYRIALPRRGKVTRFAPQQIRVTRGAYAHVTLRVDVGIR
jgi:hypothetical protein